MTTNGTRFLLFMWRQGPSAIGKSYCSAKTSREILRYRAGPAKAADPRTGNLEWDDERLRLSATTTRDDCVDPAGLYGLAGDAARATDLWPARQHRSAAARIRDNRTAATAGVRAAGNPSRPRQAYRESACNSGSSRPGTRPSHWRNQDAGRGACGPNCAAPGF